MTRTIVRNISGSKDHTVTVKGRAISIRAVAKTLLEKHAIAPLAAKALLGWILITSANLTLNFPEQYCRVMDNSHDK